MPDLNEKPRSEPRDWREYLNTWKDEMPPWQRERAEKLLDRMPSIPKPLRSLLQAVYDRARSTFDRDSVDIAIVGPVNSGKSSLLNALMGQEVATVSPVPGTTRESHWTPVGPFHIADTPGMDEADGEARTRNAMEAAQAADMILLLFDAGSGITAGSRAIHDQIKGLGKPTLVALNKMDLVRGRETESRLSAEELLGVSVVPISCKTGERLGDLMKALVLLDPRVINDMVDLLPQYQREVARQRVATSAALSAAVGWEPLPVADIVPLTVIQGLMVLEIGKLYGYEISMTRARELIGVFAGGMVLREGYRQVIKLLPFAGSLTSAAYAAAGTAALGMAAIAWFESGGHMSEEEVKRVYRDAWGKLRALVIERFRRARSSRAPRPSSETVWDEALKALDAPKGAAPPTDAHEATPPSSDAGQA